MEKLKNQICTMLPHSCSNGLSEPKSVAKPEEKQPEREPSAVITNKEIRKPWSVFGDIYFL